MRIGLVVGQIEKIGGMEKQAVLLARELRRRSIEPILFVSSPPTRRDRVDLLRLESISPKYLYRTRLSKRLSTWLLRRYCRHIGISHLIAFNVENADIAASARIQGKVALNVRGTKFSQDARVAADYRGVASKCDFLITNSENTSLLLQQAKIAGKDRITVIHNGIELPEATPSPGGKTVLYVGSIKEVKDPMTFAKACHKVVELNREARIIMIGEGDMRPSVERYIDSNGLGRNFTLMGELPYQSIPYRQASVLVNSSIRESSSNSLLEALAFGIPVVATANSGNSELLSGLRHHRLVPVSNVEEMARAIHSLLNAEPTQKLEIFEESRAFVREHYSVSKMVDGYVEVLSSR